MGRRITGEFGQNAILDGRIPVDPRGCVREAFVTTLEVTSCRNVKRRGNPQAQLADDPVNRRVNFLRLLGPELPHAHAQNRRHAKEFAR